MHILVKLCNGFAQTFLYAVPAEWQDQVTPGRVVRVPLQKRVERAVVHSILTQPVQEQYTIRTALSLEPLPHDPHYYSFIQQTASYYALDPVLLLSRFHQQEPKTAASDPEEIIENQDIDTQEHEWVLTPEQHTIVTSEQEYIHKPCFHPNLLYGVTGSGKTAVYRELIQHAYHASKTSLLLFPEVSLARTCARLLRKTFPSSFLMHECHSALTAGEKRALWQDILAERPMLIIGVHLPILLPLAHLGLIIVDEEHDPGYQEKRHPHINTKEVALLRAQRYQIPIMLGSATPSLHTWHVAEKKQWPIYRLLKRFSGAFPTIRHVKIGKQVIKNGPADAFWISSALRQAIQAQLEAGNQTIIFLNRRGVHKFVQCPCCASIFSCNSCSVMLTLHHRSELLCHYCGHKRLIPAFCPTCKAPETEFVKKGIGTQRVVSLLETLFPHARIARADTDSRRNHAGWSLTVQRMHERTIDILVGTQSITKGYHFPHVTLVGVIWAESNLSIPFYTATETMLQQLLQVAGRAGRAHQESLVIIQSYIDHPVFHYLQESQYEQFYHYEREHRHALGYPPFARLSEIELQSDDEAQLDKDAQSIAQLLRASIHTHNWPVTLLGPALPPVHKIKNRSLRKVYLKSCAIRFHIELFQQAQAFVKRNASNTSCFFTPNPVQ